MTVTVISFVVRGDGYGDFYSPVLTVMGRNILIIVERGQKNVGEKITHRSAFLVELITVVTNLTIPPVYNELTSLL